ncbi:THUMP domain-containing class I SAM-dependent RNA methyltransferase [Parvularcula bermudensis]|uniref:THUMP domain-containing class I SAM-dependent RNA methyltransferase n=1 Tax=Parvularcula bermudensis TaxID=208216 RepID=UPI000324DC33|nr:RNA methyltransferase [Parvularcula bermudensis]
MPDTGPPSDDKGGPSGRPFSSRRAKAPKPASPTLFSPDPAGRFEIFLASVPGGEDILRQEALSLGFAHPRAVPGGVRFTGGWSHVWRANLASAVASRVLVRLAQFEAPDLKRLAHQLAAFPLSEVRSPLGPVRVEAQCAKSKIFHSGAAAQRLIEALDQHGVEAVEGGEPQSPDEVPVPRLMLRLDHDRATLSLDTTGTPLHRRGLKRDVGRAPMRETLASHFLHQAAWQPEEALLDPFCGSGTFLLEAAGRATGKLAGRGRRFAFEGLQSFAPDSFEEVAKATAERLAPQKTPALALWGSDLDPTTIAAAKANAARAALADQLHFEVRGISDVAPPPGLAAGLILTNPPYGERLGDPQALRHLYATFGKVLRERFGGWRVGVITSDERLAAATRLPFAAPFAPIPHGGMRIRLWMTESLA